MKRSLSILTGIGIIAVGVWVYKTRTPVVLPPSEPVAEASPAPSPEAVGNALATASPVVSPADENESEFKKILSQLKGPDQRKLIILDEILKSHNDNDPRLDTEFKALSGPLKHAFTQYYKMIPDERRNERGTVAFLYARAMTEPKDVGFMTEVLMEKPCLSLEDCSKPASAGGPEHGHLEGIAETTASYPQLTAIQQMLERYRMALGESPPNTALANEIIESYRRVVQEQEAKNPRIAEQARRALKYLRK